MRYGHHVQRKKSPGEPGLEDVSVFQADLAVEPSRARNQSAVGTLVERIDAVRSPAPRRMIWAEVGKVAAVVALMAISAGVVIALVTRMKATSGQVERKATTLLQLWLSPDQAEQYSSYGHFEVIGSDTGKRYRIRHGRMMNVHELF